MIKGSLVDLVTPFHQDGTPDFEAVEGLVDWHVEEGSAALVVGAFTGRSPMPSADFENRTELLRRAIWQSDGRIRIIAGIDGGESVRQVVEFAQAARDAGADAALLDMPDGHPSQDELLDHVRIVARQVSGLPLIVRNMPGRDAGLMPHAVASLARIPGVVGFVECSADSNRVRALLALGLPADFALYSGHDIAARHAILLGFHGALSVTANVAPSPIRELHAAALMGDRAGSEALDSRLHPLYEALLADANSVPVKWALVEMGRIAEGLNPPVLPQSSDYSHLRRALRSAKLLG